MNLARRTFQAARLAVSMARQTFSATLFDGANDTGTRTSTVTFPLDSRREIRPEERRNLIKKARSLRNNLGLVRRIVNGTTRYSIGQGLIPTAATSDKKFNAAADAYFDRWAMSSTCDVANRRNFYQMQRVILKEMFIDGEVFGIQVKTDEGRCQVQLLKTERVGPPPVPLAQQDIFADGIECNDSEAPVRYNVLYRDRLTQLAQARAYSAEDVIHIFDPERIGQNRGLPWLYHGQNSLLDILDITAFEKVAVKLHSYFAAAITTPTGAAPKGVKARAAAATGADGGGTEDETRQYQTFLGGAAMPVLKKGEEIKFFTSDRPSTTFAGFIDFLVRDIAWGFGVSPEFIWAVAGMGGANTRFILQDAEWFFDEIRQLLIEVFCQRIYSWVIANGILNGELPACQDPNWHACNWQGPARASVDKGKDGRLYIELVANGMMTLEEWWSMFGKDHVKMRRKRIEEIAEDLAYCKEKGIPAGLYFRTMPGQAGVEEGSVSADTRPPDPETQARLQRLDELLERMEQIADEDRLAA